MIEDLDVIARYLARRDDVPEDVDCVVLCGSAVLATVDHAVAAAQDAPESTVVVTGGIGHSTDLLRQALAAHPAWGDVPTAGRTEAAMLAEVVTTRCGIAPERVVVEDRATHCGENAELTLRLLGRLGSPQRSLLIVQDPTMQRRTHAGFAHHTARLGVTAALTSRAPFVPRAEAVLDRVAPEGDAWTWDRFTALVLGEVRRLHDDERGYGPRGAGFIGSVDVPEGVLAAADRLARDPTIAPGRA